MTRERVFGPGPAGARATDVPPPDRPGLPRTALPVVQGVPRHLEAHLLRLEAGARALGTPVAGWPELGMELAAWLATEAPGADLALRLVLDPAAGLLTARLEPLPAPPRPCRLAALPHPMGGRRGDPTLIHKGLSGPWGAQLRETALGLGAEDALLLWPDGTVAETAIAALGIEVDGVLLVPPPAGRVASLAERLDLPGWAARRGLGVESVDIPLDRARTGRIWCMNALRGFWPATLLN